MKNRKVWTAFLSVFVAGVIVGAAGLGMTLRFHMKPPRDRQEFHAKVRSHLLEELVEEVRPDKAAIPAIAASLDQTLHELEAIRESVDPKVKATFERGHERIRQQLTPEQIKRFDAMLENMRTGKFGLFRPPPPPPPF
ncbi:hypothetical protein [Pseudodesulfovibrio portus]|uniref:Periplasmic heavy metal sensor n=1 Tax=Pseudodesulfovibrio portus TaxID=231439 RepID=A0ABN6RRM3_9BACT|nr:hypothetical protein [Pseudodesulfovibrio portus]BDQ33581.1 hypothetical protein JCM14722_11230 [Pseudodesulfovibrio portus]